MAATITATTVAVCVVGFRNPDDVLACLAALARSTYADFEVVVCENGGPGAAAELRRTLPDRLAPGQPVMIIEADANLGFAAGVNVCLRTRPAAAAWWILNPDAEPDPDAMAALVARLDRGDVDAAGGVIYRPDGRVQAVGGHWRGWLARPVSLGQGLPVAAVAGAGQFESQLSYLHGASMMITPRFLRRNGPMREDYFLYGEEVEWFLRGTANGLRLGLAPSAKILHRQGSSTGFGTDYATQARLPVYLNERNKLNVVRDTTPRRLPLAIGAALVLLTVRYVRHRAWRQWGYAALGWSAGVRNLRGAP